MHAIGIKYYEKLYSITVQIQSNKLIVHCNDTAGDLTSVFCYTRCNLLQSQHFIIMNAMIKNKSK